MPIEEKTAVVKSQLLYAAPVWTNQVTATIRTRTNLIHPQWTTALRVIWHTQHRTVSDKAALLFACIPPADLPGLE